MVRAAVLGALVGDCKNAVIDYQLFDERVFRVDRIKWCNDSVVYTNEKGGGSGHVFACCRFVVGLRRQA
jgi:hypothetical protein